MATSKERPHAEPVLHEGAATVKTGKEKSPAKRVFSLIFADSVGDQTIGEYVLELAVNKTREVALAGIAALFGMPGYYEGQSRNTNSSRRGNYEIYSYNHTDYNSISKKRNSQNTAKPKQIRELNYDEVEFDSWADADAALDALKRFMYSHDDKASVTNWLEICNVPCSNWTLGDWGWYDVEDAKPYRLRNGHYKVSLPQPQVLDD